MATPPMVSVVIPVFNDTDRLATCLQALARQDYTGRTEVIVADNASTQDVAAVVRRHLPQAKVVQETTPGSYAARNRALREASGEVLAFTDSDCLPAPDWIAQGVAALQADAGLAMVAGRVELFAQDPHRPTAAELYDMVFNLDQERYVREMHFGATANLFTWRTTLERVGAFNAQLKSGGDFEWGQRVHAAGLRQGFAAGALVRHPARRGLRELARKARRVRGGYHDLGHLRSAPRQRLRRWAIALLPPTAVLPRVRAVAGRSGQKAAVKLYFAAYYMKAVRAGEEIRLALGGTSQR